MALTRPYPSHGKSVRSTYEERRKPPPLAQASETPETPADRIELALTRDRAEGEARARRLLAEMRVEAAARGRLHDPSDAPAMIDLDTVNPDEPASIATAISALVASGHSSRSPFEERHLTANAWVREGFRATKATRLFP